MRVSVNRDCQAPFPLPGLHTLADPAIESRSMVQKVNNVSPGINTDVVCDVGAHRGGRPLGLRGAVGFLKTHGHPEMSKTSNPLSPPMMYP